MFGDGSGRIFGINIPTGVYDGDSYSILVRDSFRSFLLAMSNIPNDVRSGCMSERVVSVQGCGSLEQAIGEGKS